MIAHRSVCLLALLSVTVHCAPDASSDAANTANEDATDVTAGVVAATGHVFGTDGDGLNVRAEPSTSAAIVAHLAEGTSVDIACQISGGSVEGNTLWDYLPDHGGYVSDRYLYTGYDGPIPGVPTCGGEAPPEEGGDCNGLDYIGECQGETLVWCENDALRTRDCAAASQSCGYQNDTIGYNCLGGGGGGSGDVLTVSEIVGGGFDISQGFGPTDYYGGYGYCNDYVDYDGNFHCATDISIEEGRTLYIPVDGTVTIAGESMYFEYADIKTSTPGKGELRIERPDGTLVILGHLQQIWVSTGEGVTAGETAGISGWAGTGAHLHLEVRVPNGYGGYEAVDPMTYFGW